MRMLRVSCIVFLMLFCCYCSQPDSDQSPKQQVTESPSVAPPVVLLEAELINKEGSKIKMTNLRVHFQDSCGGITYYRGIPRTTDTYYDYLPVHTGDYILRIPLAIIKSINVHTITTKEETNSFENSWYTITLGDNTVIEGIPNDITDFVGSTDLGETKINSNLLKALNSVHKPLPVFIAKGNGERSAELLKSDETRVSFAAVTFIEHEKNENGCFLREVYPISGEFNLNSAKYDLMFDKIAIIKFNEHLKVREYDDFYFPVCVYPVITTTEGREVKGYFSSIRGVEGIIEVGAYKLLAELPFNSNAKSLTLH